MLSFPSQIEEEMVGVSGAIPETNGSGGLSTEGKAQPSDPGEVAEERLCSFLTTPHPKISCGLKPVRYFP